MACFDVAWRDEPRDSVAPGLKTCMERPSGEIITTHPRSARRVAKAEVQALACLNDAVPTTVIVCIDGLLATLVACMLTSEMDKPPNGGPMVKHFLVGRGE